MSVAAVLRQKGKSIVSVTPDTPVVEAAKTIASQRIGALVVLDPTDRVVGIISERDICRVVAERAEGAAGLKVQDLMTRGVVMISPDTPVQAAMEIMDEGYFRHLPVCDAEGKLLGLVSIRDLVKYSISLQQSDVESLKAYVSRSHMH
jgi:CBS domain-containing protein